MTGNRSAPVASGSSPHARGLRPPSARRRPGNGIIPARAGFTTRTRPAPTCPWDHPRTRGVYPRTAAATGCCVGSSPHARGLLRLPPDDPGVVRIIPARAGFTRATVADNLGVRDHPRTRGVYLNRIDAEHVWQGSSPHARGLRDGGGGGPGGGGIIPARAGFTTPAVTMGNHTADHPRTRGVYPVFSESPLILSGSSPHARGLLASLAVAAVPGRIIPARAGFTHRVRSLAFA